MPLNVDALKPFESTEVHRKNLVTCTLDYPCLTSSETNQIHGVEVQQDTSVKMDTPF